MTIEQYKVFWQFKDGKANGVGQNPTTFEIAKAIASDCNRRHPAIEHWASVSSFSFEHAQKMKL